MRVKLAAVIVLSLLVCAAYQSNGPQGAGSQTEVAQKPCDRACLEKAVDQYMDAMLEHQVSPALFAKDCKFTENGVRLPLGDEGLWASMVGKGTYKFYVPDVEAQQVAFIGTVLEGGSAPKAKTLAGDVSAKLAAASAKPKPAAKAAEPTLVAFALRLKIVNNLITEVEQLAIRPETSLGGGGARGGAGAATTPSGTGVAVEKMGSPRKIFSEIIPEAERPSRDELIKVANYYFTGLARNDGKGFGGTGTYPFTDDCERIENGMVACSPTKNNCKEQFANGSLFNIVSRIRDRRFVAVDRERGIVFAFGFFDHEQINWTWQIAELFKIEKGKFRSIEAIFARAPYGINSGWSSYEKSISEEPQTIK